MPKIQLGWQSEFVDCEIIVVWRFKHIFSVRLFLFISNLLFCKTGLAANLRDDCQIITKTSANLQKLPADHFVKLGHEIGNFFKFRFDIIIIILESLVLNDICSNYRQWWRLSTYINDSDHNCRWQHGMKIHSNNLTLLALNIFPYLAMTTEPVKLIDLLFCSQRKSSSRP